MAHNILNNKADYRHHGVFSRIRKLPGLAQNASLLYYCLGICLKIGIYTREKRCSPAVHITH